MQPEFTNILTQTIIPALSTILIALVSWASAEAIAWIKEHTKGKRAERLSRLMEHVQEVVETTVTTADETLVKTLKQEGNFGPEKQAEVKHKVLGSVKKQIGPIIDELANMGIAEIDEILHTKIERAVSWQKDTNMLRTAK